METLKCQAYEICAVCDEKLSTKDMLNFIQKEESSTTNVRFSYQCPKCGAIVEISIIL